MASRGRPQRFGYAVMQTLKQNGLSEHLTEADDPDMQTKITDQALPTYRELLDAHADLCYLVTLLAGEPSSHPECAGLVDALQALNTKVVGAYVSYAIKLWQYTRLIAINSRLVLQLAEA